MSVLNMSDPDLFAQLSLLGVELLWHPSLSTGSPDEHERLLDAIRQGRRRLDIFCLEGNVVMGPNGSGLFDTWRGVPKRELVEALAKEAHYVLAIGTCASFGGMGSSEEDEIQGTGLQYHQHRPGGFLGTGFRSKAGLPVINLSGCPVHPKAFELTLQLLTRGLPVELDALNRPRAFFEPTVHNGCTRNVSHEFKLEDTRLGEDGCLFFNLGCKGPTTHASCNSILWNGQNSKTRAGVPCFGCTRPDFPMPAPFFKTEKIAGTPIELPEGVDRAHYLAYKDLAAAAAPAHLRHRHCNKGRS